MSAPSFWSSQTCMTIKYPSMRPQLQKKVSLRYPKNGQSGTSARQFPNATPSNVADTVNRSLFYCQLFKLVLLVTISFQNHKSLIIHRKHLHLFSLNTCAAGHPTVIEFLSSGAVELLVDCFQCCACSHKWVLALPPTCSALTLSSWHSFNMELECFPLAAPGWAAPWISGDFRLLEGLSSVESVLTLPHPSDSSPHTLLLAAQASGACPSGFSPWT